MQRRATTFVPEGATLLHVGSSDLARHLVPELPELLAPNFVRDPQPIIICCSRSRLVTELLSVDCRRIRVRSLAWEPARGIEAGGPRTWNEAASPPLANRPTCADFSSDGSWARGLAGGRNPAKTSMTARETMQANWNEPKFGFVTRPASPRDLHAIAVGPRTEVVCSGSLDDVP